MANPTSSGPSTRYAGVFRTPNGRYRAIIFDPASARNVNVSTVLGKRGTYATAVDARDARDQARLVLQTRASTVDAGPTLREFWERWTTDPRFARRLDGTPKRESTLIQCRRRTRRFVELYGDLTLSSFDEPAPAPQRCTKGELLVAQWYAEDPQRIWQVPVLKTLFNAASSTRGGRLLVVNPFGDLRLPSQKGNRGRRPPSADQLENMVKVAYDLTPPSFAGLFEFGALTAARPSELDALRWEHIDFEQRRAYLAEQWNTVSRSFTPPKTGPYTVALCKRALRVLSEQPRESEFVFVNQRGGHYSHRTRATYWERVRCAAGFPKLRFYLATRHFYGSYALNVLKLPPHVIATQFGHQDGGQLVIRLYGHPDEDVALERLKEAFDEQLPR